MVSPLAAARRLGPISMHSQPDDLIGKVIAGRYKVLERLGRGGMGTVYLAEHEAIQKRVALKVLHPEFSAKPELVERFQREAISASRIKHMNVLDVFDFGQVENGCFFLAMEYLEGHDLADELEHHGVLEPEPRAAVTLQMCRALSAAHARGVVHRDLKPENVFLHATGDGEEAGQAGGLRYRPAAHAGGGRAVGTPPSTAHSHGHDLRDAGVHVDGASRRQACGPAQRRLRHRHLAVRDADRRGALHWAIRFSPC